MTLPVDSKLRKEYPIYSGFFKYFPRAIAAVAHVSWIGNQQHHPDKPLHWDKKKSMDQEDCLLRHLLDDLESPADIDGTMHYAKQAWRSMAALEIRLENIEKKNDKGKS